MAVVDVKRFAEFREYINSEDKHTVVLFSANWATQCKHVLAVLEDLAKLLNSTQFINIVAEDFVNESKEFKVDAVPTVIFFGPNGKYLDRVDGADIPSITSKSRNLCGIPTDTLRDRLKALINKAPVMVFMKGDRVLARCGYSKALRDILDDTEIPYETFDILSDEEVRQGLKIFSDWPTYPQVYVNGELIGGIDIIKEHLKNDKLEKVLKGEIS